MGFGSALKNREHSGDSEEGDVCALSVFTELASIRHDLEWGKLQP